MISRDTRFDTSNSEGFSNNDSNVINITIGNNEISHVGSSLILAEKNMMDIIDDYKKNVNVSNEEYSTPMINRVVNAYKNAIVGKSKIILVLSQNGTPLATYAGDKVSTFPTDIPKSTAFLIDDKVLIIYRCDYTVYDKALLDE